MNFTQSIKIGLVELKSNKLRSFLTMLGVIFGVAAVIASVAIGEGAKQDASRQLALLGTTTLRITPLKLDAQLKAQSLQKNPEGLNNQDVVAIKGSCPYIKKIAPLVYAPENPYRQGRSLDTPIVATTPDFMSITKLHPSSGRLFVEADAQKAARVCILGSEAGSLIFRQENPVGQALVLGDSIYVVVGVMEDKQNLAGGSSLMTFRNVNKDIYVPLETAIKRLQKPDDRNQLSELLIMVDDERNVVAAASLIERILTRLHGGLKDFEITIPIELLKQSQASQKRFNMVLAAIAGISLLVGGIGIMNIMLAGVTQRIQEIGIRRALGATRRDILSQFLIEATVLSLSGGIIGIGTGVGIGRLIVMYAQWSTVYSLKAIGISIAVAVAVGVIFGMYPARKAAALNPIEALRHE